MMFSCIGKLAGLTYPNHNLKGDGKKPYAGSVLRRFRVRRNPSLKKTYIGCAIWSKAPLYRGMAIEA